MSIQIFQLSTRATFTKPLDFPELKMASGTAVQRSS
jgi:hypothetical protein